MSGFLLSDRKSSGSHCGGYCTHWLNYTASYKPACLFFRLDKLKTPTSFLTVRSSLWRVSASETQRTLSIFFVYCDPATIIPHLMKHNLERWKRIFLCRSHLPWLLPWILSPVCAQHPSHQLSAACTVRCGARLHLLSTHASRGDFSLKDTNGASHGWPPQTIVTEAQFHLSRL